MLRLAMILWTLVGTTLAGCFILVVVSVPGLFDQGMQLIPLVVVAGFVVAIPISVLVARAITQPKRSA